MSQLSPVFYDCEATCIGGLPIEIGWAFVDEATGLIQSESHLVKPPAHWDLAAVWDPDAQKLHKITRQQLISEGRSPSEIVGRMNEVLAGRELFADAPVDDERWLFMIWEQTGVPAFTNAIVLVEPTFTIHRTHAHALLQQLAADKGWNAARYEAAMNAANQLAPRTHRAEADARNLAVLWQIIAADQ
jgi:hypothetical protein